MSCNYETDILQSMEGVKFALYSPLTQSFIDTDMDRAKYKSHSWLRLCHYVVCNWVAEVFYKIELWATC
jgi:hypothetical protein